MDITGYQVLIRVTRDLQSSLEDYRKGLIETLTFMYEAYLPDIISGVCDPYPTHFLYFKSILFVWCSQSKRLYLYNQDKLLNLPDDVKSFADFAASREDFWDELMLLNHKHSHLAYS